LQISLFLFKLLFPRFVYIIENYTYYVCKLLYTLSRIIINKDLNKVWHSFCYTRFALLAPLARLLWTSRFVISDAVEYTLPLLFQKQALSQDPDPGLLIQDLEPDHFTCDLVAVAHTQIVIQMALAVEPNHVTVVIASPVLRVDTH